MAASASSSDDDVISGINVTPLVDVTLVLLIIMMVTAKISLSQAMPMDLPKGSAAPGAVVEMMSLRLTADNKIVLNEEAVPSAQVLLQKARAAKASNPEVKAVVKADGKAKHGAVIQVLDVLRQAGIDKVAFAKPKSGEAPVPVTP
jgi:biopolymer transport protein ExbD